MHADINHDDGHEKIANLAVVFLFGDEGCEAVDGVQEHERCYFI